MIRPVQNIKTIEKRPIQTISKINMEKSGKSAKIKKTLSLISSVEFFVFKFKFDLLHVFLIRLQLAAQETMHQSRQLSFFSN